MHATVRFAIDPEACPLTFSFQAARLALVHHVVGRVIGRKLDRPAPGMLILSAHEKEMAAILAELATAQVFSPLVLDVVADDDQGVEDYAEQLRDRTNQVVIIARKAPQGPAS